ncbi:MAG: hypothetical protein HRU20_06320 [Pseudomonadales bacterium]|nr:hypothetical protein [Pseudomonadales bacterium]
MQCFSSAEGSVSALMGICNFGLAVIAGSVSSLWVQDDLLPMALCIWCKVAVALVSCLAAF